MKFSVLASGSKANSLYVESHDQAILVDCGLSYKQTALRIAEVGGDVAKVKAIIITHEHGDHVKGLAVTAKKLEVPIYCSQGTSEALNLLNSKSSELVKIVQGFDIEEIAGFTVSFYPAVHDSHEPIFVTLKCRQFFKLGVLTDMGKINQHVLFAMKDLNALVLEANYDEELLEICEYPWEVKQRIRSSHGHLSNEQAVKFLEEINTDKLRHLVLAHISENSNSSQKVLDTVKRGFSEWTQLKNLLLGSVNTPTHLIDCSSGSSDELGLYSRVA